MSYLKQYGTSAKGNDRLLKEYGGSSGSSPMARQRYATGGAVKSGNPSLSEGLGAAGADGAPAKPSLARPGRKAPGKKGGKTNVNVIVMPTKGDGPPGGPPPPMPPMGPPPGAGPMPPPGPGGPPMPPMRKSGGRVQAFKKGGRVKREEGGRISEDSKREAKRLRNEDDKRSASWSLPLGVGSGVALAAGKGLARKIGIGTAGVGAANLIGHATDSIKNNGLGDKLKQADRIEKGLVKEGEEDRKSGGRACKKEGGPAISGFNAGAGGAKGRLEKMKKYGK